MPITDTAQKNHEELFPNHQSTLKLTDPELIEVFDNFAFDEAGWGPAGLTPRLLLAHMA